MSSLGTVLIGGGTGFIGSALRKKLTSLGYNVMVVSRKPGIMALSWEELTHKGLPDNCVGVMNLAGQNVLDPTRRWTPGFKQNVVASRVHTTASLASAILKATKPPKVLATISGVGYYPPSESAEYTEDSDGGTSDFLAQLCQQWEDAGKLDPTLGVRRAILRSGVVLGKDGGMIKQLYWPFFLGLGGPVGSGKQYMPWIHIDDLVGLFVFALENDKVSGVLNAVAPQPITNQEFAQAFAKALHRPAFIPLPTFALNLAFNPERALMMTQGQKVIPKRTLELGYQFTYPTIEDACKSLV